MFRYRVLGLIGFLVVFVFVCCMPLTVQASEIIASGACGDGLLWTLEENGTLTISGSGEMDDFDYFGPWYNPVYNYVEHVVICDGVESIGARAFSGCSELLSVSISSTVSYIGEYAFQGCTRLHDVYIYDIQAWCESSFGNVEANPMYYAKKLYLHNLPVVDLLIPEGTTRIGDYVFYNCSDLQCVTIPESVTEIGDYAFYNCVSLKDASVPCEVRSVGSYAFYGCKNLTSELKFCQIETVSDYVFYDCASLTVVEIPYGVTTIGGYAFCNCINLVDMVLPVSVRAIGESAFYNCRSMKSINIPHGVERIWGTTFNNCSSLSEINIPDTVNIIGKGAFSGCSSLESMTIPFVGMEIVDTSWGTWGADYPFGFIFGDKSYDGGVATQQCYNFYNGINNGTYYIPSSLKHVTVTGGNIIYGSFSNCSLLTDITIPSVSLISDYAFSGCESLRSILIPDSVIYIGDFAFSGCANLDDLIIPNHVSSIGESAFKDCSSLTSIVLPRSVASLGSSAFYNCSSLTSAELSYYMTSVLDYTFYNCSSLETMIIPQRITQIGISAFDGCGSLKKIEISDRVTSIGAFAFRNCGSLIEIQIPMDVKDIGESALSGCGSLEELTIPFIGSDERDSNNFGYFFGTSSYDGGVATNQGDIIYYIPRSLKHVTVTGGNIGDCAFQNCSGLLCVVIPNSASGIGDRAFENCRSLTDMSIPSGVTKIGAYAFRGCSSLTGITLANGLLNIGNSAFENCRMLSSITIPDSVNLIGQSVFHGCSGLTEMTVPFIGKSPEIKNATAYTLFGYFFGSSPYDGGNATKQYCNSSYSSVYYIPDKLASVTVTGEVIYYGAFYNCANIRSITLTERMVSVEDYAFYGCDNLYAVYMDNANLTAAMNNHAANGLLCYRAKSIAIPETAVDIGTYITNNYTLRGNIQYNGVHYSLYADHTCDWFYDNNVICCTICDIRQEHTHEFTLTVTPPTCAERGYTAYTCWCNVENIVSYTEPLAHSETVVQAVAPTCTESGLTQGSCCAECGEVLTAQKVIPATGHSYLDEVTESTCTERGYTIHTCQNCGDRYTDAYVSAPGHKEITDKAVAATCTESGLTEGKHCAVCGEVTVARREIPARGHTEVIDQAVTPTCSAAGLTEGRHCSVCNEVFIAQKEISATGHDMRCEGYNPPDCVNRGYTRYECFRCDYIEMSYEPALGHLMGNWCQTKAPTCTQAGEERRVCQRYECISAFSEIREIPAKGHQYAEVITDPACTEQGYTTHICKCGDSYVDTYVEAPGHTEVTDGAVEPTCSESGLTEGKHCCVCGTVTVKQETVNAKGHSWDAGVVTKEATESTEGERVYTCTVCKETKTEVIPTLEHVHCYTASVTEPTCTEPGYTQYTCRCGDGYRKDEVPALGHSEVTDKAVEATCTESGLTEGKHCAACGAVTVKQNVVPAKGHTEVVDKAAAATCTKSGLTEGKHCSVCGTVMVKQETVPVKDHAWDDGRVTKEPTEKTEGERTYTCTACGETKTEGIPVLAHTHKYVSVVTKPTCTERGYTTYSCTCGDSYRTDIKSPTGHTFTLWIVTQEPAGGVPGMKTRLCCCGHNETEAVINPFVDVPAGKYFSKPVFWAFENGITTGKTATTFALDADCTRKQIVMFLWRAAGEPEPQSMENPFVDVKADQFQKAILWAYYEGITSGKTATEFQPEAPCTREQIVMFLWRYFGKPEPQSMNNPFTDVRIGGTFEKAILWAYYEGITTGKTATTFEPQATCTRGQIVTFLYRAMAE